jgi:hypothetical protein
MDVPVQWLHPGHARALSAVAPGLGHVYAGRVRRGVALALWYTVSLFLNIVFVWVFWLTRIIGALSKDNEFNMILVFALALQFVTLGSLVWSWLYSIRDVVSVVDSGNRALRDRAVVDGLRETVQSAGSRGRDSAQGTAEKFAPPQSWQPRVH